MSRRIEKRAKRLLEKMPRRPEQPAEPRDAQSYGVRARAWAERASAQAANEPQLRQRLKELMEEEDGPGPEVLDVDFSKMTNEEIMEFDPLRIGAPVEMTYAAARALWATGAAPHRPGERYMEVCRELGNWHARIAWQIGDQLVHAHRPHGQTEVDIWVHGEHSDDDSAQIYRAGDPD